MAKKPNQTVRYEDADTVRKSRSRLSASVGKGLARPFDRMQRSQLMGASGLDCFEKQPPARRPV